MPHVRVLKVLLALAIASWTMFSSDLHAMTLSGSPATTAAVGKTYSFRPGLNGANNGVAKFYIASRPSWASFSGSTGTITGTPTAAGSWKGIQITAWDGTHVATLPAFTITVGGTASAVAVKISGVPSATADAGAYYGFTPTVTATSGVKLTFTISNKPSWASFNASNGSLSGTPSTSNIATFSSIGIAVTDGKTSASLPAFKITVAKAANGSALVSWTKPLTNTDGSKLSNLSGYRIHYGNSLSSLTKNISIGSPATTSASIEGLARGTWYFAVVAYTTAGIESAMSSAASKTIN